MNGAMILPRNDKHFKELVTLFKALIRFGVR